MLLDKRRTSVLDGALWRRAATTAIFFRPAPPALHVYTVVVGGQSRPVPRRLSLGSVFDGVMLFWYCVGIKYRADTSKGRHWSQCGRCWSQGVGERGWGRGGGLAHYTRSRGKPQSGSCDFAVCCCPCWYTTIIVENMKPRHD